MAETTCPGCRERDETVSDLADSGPGPLRQAVLDANHNPGADRTVFAPGPHGTIALRRGELAVTGCRPDPCKNMS
jgi:hypothetical protein